MRWQEGEVAVSVILSSKRKAELLKAWKLSEGQDWKLIHDSLIRMLMFIELQDFSHLLSSKMKKNGVRESFLFCLFLGSWELTLGSFARRNNMLQSKASAVCRQELMRCLSICWRLGCV